MAVMDEFKEERAKLKDASLKEKLDYFWYYYKWHVIISVAAVVLLVSFIHDIVTRKDTVFNVVVINHYTTADLSEAYRRDLETYLGIDTDTEDTSIDSSLTIDFSSYSKENVSSTEKLMALAAAASLDILVADETVFKQYAANSFFLDLSEFLDPETFAAIEPYLYYAETEEGSFPAGFYLDDCTRFLGTYLPHENTRSVMGVFANLPHKEYAIAFLKYVLQNS